MENVTVFHRDWAERAILRTEVTEGMAVGPGCANSADAAPGATTAKLRCGGAGSFFIGCCHLSVEVPNEKGVLHPAAAARAAWGQKSGRAVRQKWKPRKAHRRNMWGIFCLDLHCGIQQQPFWEWINPSADCDRGFETHFPLNCWFFTWKSLKDNKDFCLPCLWDNYWCTVLGHSKGLAFGVKSANWEMDLSKDWVCSNPRVLGHSVCPLPAYPPCFRNSSSALCSLLVSFCKRWKLWHGKTTSDVLGQFKMDDWGFLDEKAIN